MSDEMRFTAQEFGTLCEWLMASDPFPLEQSRRQRMVDMLNDEAQTRGYDDWIQAYHDNRMEADPREDYNL